MDKQNNSDKMDKQNNSDKTDKQNNSDKMDKKESKKIKLYSSSSWYKAQTSDILSSSPKILKIIQLVQSILEKNEQVAIFSFSVQTLNLVAKMLTETKTVKTPTPILTGQSSSNDREKMIDAFQNGKEKVLLLSSKAGGLGITLTKGTHVILTDPWWHPFVEFQSIKRVHRKGQTKNVMVWRLVMEEEESIDLWMIGLQKSKLDDAKRIMPDLERYSDCFVLGSDKVNLISEFKRWLVQWCTKYGEKITVESLMPKKRKKKVKKPIRKTNAGKTIKKTNDSQTIKNANDQCIKNIKSKSSKQVSNIKSTKQVNNNKNKSNNDDDIDEEYDYIDRNNIDDYEDDYVSEDDEDDYEGDDYEGDDYATDDEEGYSDEDYTDQDIDEDDSYEDEDYVDYNYNRNKRKQSDKVKPVSTSKSNKSLSTSTHLVKNNKSKVK